MDEPVSKPVAVEIKTPVEKPMMNFAPEKAENNIESLVIVRAGFFYQSKLYTGIHELDFETRKSKRFTFTCAWCNCVKTYQYTEDFDRDKTNVVDAHSFIIQHTGCSRQLLAEVAITTEMASGFCLKTNLLETSTRGFSNIQKSELLALEARTVWIFKLSRFFA